jgi:hypothetical protein
VVPESKREREREGERERERERINLIKEVAERVSE